VRRLGRVVAGEAAHAAAVVLCAALGAELHAATARLFKFTVRHLKTREVSTSISFS
jgi:hypothetical protein